MILTDGTTESQLGKPEEIHCSADAQTITLRAVSMYLPEYPYPTELKFKMWEWNEERGDFYEGLPSSTNQPDDFYHASEDMENGVPVVKISLKRNDTGETRKVMIWVFSNKMYGTHTIFGNVIIYQEPETGESQPFSLKAKYKDKIYTTEAEIDAEGNYIFHNPEYAQLMKDIDEMPDVNMVLLDNSTIFYYDREDILDNKPYYDAIAVNEGSQPTTRATGFEDFDTSFLGYIAIYDNDHFGGSKLAKGLENFHFTWNLPNLKDYSMNDKVTSIAVAFNHSDPLVCTVLTVWDDTDYNHGDKYRSKHRISIIASKYSPRVTCEDLKKLKKIGSSSSWNDCISSISFHFGYLDSLLVDY